LNFSSEAEAVTYIFRSMRKLRGQTRPPDDIGRTPEPTRRLIEALDLLAVPRDYTVVTGSKGKGSTTMMTARLLRSLDYRVGTITSPHLVTWRERIRVDGRAIPESDFLRLLDSLAPTIDAIEATLDDATYFSPTGIFLAMALRWFDEQGVDIAVLEVGRGGRFDDIALVPNHVALFAPITLEHSYWLGPSLERIAWHKAGIIKPGGMALSVPQPPEVWSALQSECALQEATLREIPAVQILGPADNGWRIANETLGEMTLPLLGRYQAVNAALALAAAQTMRAHRGEARSDDALRLRAGVAQVHWPGRLQRLQDNPAVFLDGAVTRESAQSVMESLEVRLTRPLVSILAVPDDKDYAGVCEVVGPQSDLLILTSTERNPILHFPGEAVASAYNARYRPTLDAALETAKEAAGSDGTILILGTQSIVADAILLWGFSYETL